MVKDNLNIDLSIADEGFSACYFFLTFEALFESDESPVNV